SQGIQDRDPVRRELRCVLRPGDQRHRARPGGGQALGGIPLLDHGPEPVAEGFARPVELPTLVAAGTVNKGAYAALPPAPSGAVTFPTEAQQNAAEAVVSANWTKQVG